ncbi:hypothetical protein AB0M34_28790 [Nocardia sp. NPDC050193]
MTYEVNKEEADPRYLAYYFAHGPGLEAVRSASPGSAGRNRTLGIDRFYEQKIALPGKNEQKRLADKLDYLLGRCSSMADLRRSASNTRNALAESWIGRSVNNSCKSALVGEVLEFDRIPVSVDPEQEYRTIGIRSFGKGIIHHPPKSGSDLSKLNYFSFLPERLVLSNLMAWEGGISVTGDFDSKFLASNRFFFYKAADDRVNISFVRHFLLSSTGLKLISSVCSSGAERNRTMGRKRFEALELPLPSREEQDRIAGTLDCVSERMEQVHNDPTFDALRPAILNAAFTGRL